MIGALAIAFSALLWSLDGVFIRPQFYRLPAALVVLLEHGLGFIILLPFVVKGWQEVRNMKLSGWMSLLWVCIWGGLIGTLFITKAFFAAFEGETSLATVVILQKLQPVFALIIARILLKEKLRPQFYIWAGVAILAAYLLAFGQEGLNLRDVSVGNKASFFALIAAFSFGSSTVLGKSLSNHVRFDTAAGLRFGGTTLLAFVVVLVAGLLPAISRVEPIHWKLLLLIVFSSGAVSIFIYYFGLKRIPASVASIFELFWPLSSVALDYFINKNVLSPVQAVASAVLLFSFYMIIRPKRPKAELKPNNS